LAVAGALFFTEDRTVTLLFEELDFEEVLEVFGEREATRKNSPLGGLPLLP
jgi:hypothetical protein